MKKNNLFSIIILILIIACSNIIFAQETFNIFGGSSRVTISSDEPYIITNDKNGELEKLEFKKNVKAESDDFNLFASGSLIYFKKDEIVIAEGDHVSIVQGKKAAENKVEITCKKASFFVNEGRSVFIGNPRIEQGDGNVSEGDEITIKQHDDGSSTMIVTPFKNHQNPEKDHRATLEIKGEEKQEAPPEPTEGPKEIIIDEVPVKEESEKKDEM